MAADQRRIIRLALAVLAVVLVLCLWWWASGPPTNQESSGSPQTTATASARDTSGLPPVQVADLPREARRTLDLISAGGYYHEYTVPTPGGDDRGARRIFTGKAGERYWTDDHYESFDVIEDGGR